MEPGDYPVDLSVIRFDDEPDHIRVAAARLTISTEPVTSWDMALRPGQDPKALPDGHYFEFGVDSGTGCFVDAAALPAIGQLPDHVFEDLFPDIGGSRTADLDHGANLVTFHSGWGDGGYPTWIGRTADGRVACFIADMLIVDKAATPNQHI